MELNEIKKILYKEKPIAMLKDNGVSGVRGASAVTGSTYEANTSAGVIKFFVLHHEMGDVHFMQEEPAQLLIRWIVA